MENPATTETAWRDRPTVTIPEAAALLGVSKSSIYRAAHAGTFPVVRVQSRFVVPTAALARLLELEPLDPARGDGAA
jgi:excisionase family DNA binding protein